MKTGLGMRSTRREWDLISLSVSGLTSAATGFEGRLQLRFRPFTIRGISERGAGRDGGRDGQRVVARNRGGGLGRASLEGRRYGAFTLVEMIAVLSVMAILVAVIAPSVIRRVDRAAWTAETANLGNIGNALTQSILRTKTIPSYTNVASTIASQMSLPVSAITTNSSRYARAFLVDPALTIGGGLPYTQGTNGTDRPISARMMIISSLSRPLPVGITNGVPSATNFTAIWNAAENTVPAAPAFTGWGGTGEDLRIRKLNLEPLFYQLILVDHTGDTNNVPRYSIDGSSPVTFPAGPLGLNKYFLDGTVVGLHDGSGQVQSRHLLKRNISFLFESSTWRGLVQGDQQSFSASGADFFNHAVTFFNHATNPNSTTGGSQYGVIIAMYTFMFDYTYWANECPHFSYHNNSISSVPEYKLLDNQGQNNGNVSSFSLDLIAHP